MKRDELIAELQKRGVEVPEGAAKRALEELLKQAEGKAVPSETPAEQAEEQPSAPEEPRNYFHDVDWRVFTEEQTRILKDLAAKRLPHLMAASLQHLRPEQEHQLQALVDILTENEELPDSKVRDEITEMEMRGEKIDTPEKEAAFQEKLDAEKRSHLEKRKKKS